MYNYVHWNGNNTHYIVCLWQLYYLYSMFDGFKSKVHVLLHSALFIAMNTTVSLVGALPP